MITLPQGHVLNGTYEIKSTLGQGGFGITYHGVDRYLASEVAIKEFFPGDEVTRLPNNTVVTRGENKANFDFGLDRFLQEARIIASLKHPNVIQVQTFFKANGTAYLVMPFVQGTTLDEAITERFWCEVDIANFLYWILDGLSYLHKAGLIHRDIKPANILLLEDGTPLLLDFGAARYSSSKIKTAILTEGFAPPEQYETEGKQGSWSDIYALGGVAYQMVTGSPPSENALNRKSKDKLKPAVEAAASRYNPDFLQTIDDAMRPKIKNRLQSAEQWLKRLQPIFIRAEHAYTQKLFTSLWATKTQSKYVKLGKLLEGYGYKNRTATAIDKISRYLRTVGLCSNLDTYYPTTRDGNVTIKPIESPLDPAHLAPTEADSQLPTEILAMACQEQEFIASFFRSIGIEDLRSRLSDDGSAWLLSTGSAQGRIRIVDEGSAEASFSIEATLMELPSDSDRQLALMRELMVANLQQPHAIRFGIMDNLAITSAILLIAGLRQEDFDETVFSVMSITDNLDDELIARYGKVHRVERREVAAISAKEIPWSSLPEEDDAYEKLVRHLLRQAGAAQEKPIHFGFINFMQAGDGDKKSGSPSWYDPPLSKIGSVSMIARAPQTLQAHPYLSTLRCRDYSFVSLEESNVTETGESTFLDAVRQPLMDLPPEKNAPPYWFETMFRHCKGKAFAYCSVAPPPANLLLLAQRHNVEIIHLGFERDDAKEVQARRYFHFNQNEGRYDKGTCLS